MTAFTPEQEKDIAYYEAHFDQWLADIAYRNKHVVIANQQTQGVFDEFATALDFATDHFQAGKFLIQEIIDPNDRVSTTGFKYPLNDANT